MARSCHWANEDKAPLLGQAAGTGKKDGRSPDPQLVSAFLFNPAPCRWQIWLSREILLFSSSLKILARPPTAGFGDEPACPGPVKKKKIAHQLASYKPCFQITPAHLGCVILTMSLPLSDFQSPWLTHRDRNSSTPRVFTYKEQVTCAWHKQARHM